MPDLIAGLCSLISLIVFLRFWKPPYREEFACTYTPTKQHNDEEATPAENTERDEKAQVSYLDGDNAGNSTTHDGNESLHSKNSNKKGGAAVGDVPDPEAITPISDIAKPTLYESILAWSPWVCIVVVVIM